jgi:copper resistance protein C
MKTAIGALAFITALLPAPTVSAHAFLERAAPAVGGVVHAPLAELRLWFSEKLDPAFGSVRVLDAHGKQVDKRDPSLDPDDHRLLRVSLPALAPGTYRVVWRVRAHTHLTRGDFTFEMVR